MYCISTFIVSNTVLVSDDGHTEVQDWCSAHKRLPSFFSGATHAIKVDTLFDNLQACIRFSALCQGTIAVLFGGLHTFAWFSHYPSAVEKTLWRVSSLLMIGIPLVFTAEICAVASSFGLLLQYNQRPWRLGFRVVLFAFYLVARGILLTLAFTMLREGLKQIYQDVQWTSYIPHL
jgi:hypothetical protein